MLSLMSGVCLAQDGDGLSLKGDGSTVVITVLALVFVGMFLYLIMTDRKISKLEKEFKDKEK